MHLKNKHKVYLCQVNNRYGDNVFLPYSVGLLQAFCQADPEIRNNFEFGDFIYLREDPVKIARKIDNPKVIGISCYIWNWEYCKALAQAMKAQHPECLVVFGGTQVPLRSEGFFVEHPYVDLIVHYEGELIFADILKETLSLRPDFTKIPGISVRVESNQTFKTLSRERILDLTQLPSPYLTGVFDELMGHPYSFHGSQETHRGCPYSCAFCDWGGSVFAKVRAFETERLVQEFEWFGRHRVELLYNCDANYGLLPRDHGLTVKMAEVKARCGYPQKFRAAYAKNSNEAVFAIAKVLNDAGMNKGITLSFQSMDENTLGLIKRKNIKITNFRELMKRYRLEQIATYTELILGLPGETYETFKAGINTLIESGQHDSLNIYVCAKLPNSEMNDPDYVQLHNIQSVRAPILLTHSTPSEDPITEFHDMIIGTRTMSVEDWKKTYLFSWAIQCFHCLSLTQFLAVFFNKQYGLLYSDFYESLINYCREQPSTFIGSQFSELSAIIDNATKGGSVEMVIPKFGNITWPLEEAIFLNLISEKEKFYQEIKDFLLVLVGNRGYNISAELLGDLITYQSAMIIDPYSGLVFDVSLNHNLHQYFLAAYIDDVAEVTQTSSKITVTAVTSYNGDLERYAREVIWYGRKGGQFRHSNVAVQDI